MNKGSLALPVNIMRGEAIGIMNKGTIGLACE